VDHSLSTFLSGCAPFHDVVLFSKSLDEMDDADQPNATFFMFNRGALSRFAGSAAWPAVSMATLKPGDGQRVLVAIGPNGEAWEGLTSNATHTAGRIGISEQSWRSLAAIQGEIYACGMGRVAALRTGPHQWRDISAPSPAKDKRILGFEDIDGFSSADLYAVGWHGEIWHRKSGKWRQVDSPVSANLNAVCCAGDGVAYAVGDGGVMLRGRNDEWEAIESGRPENLQDVRDHERQVYVTTDFEILQLTEDGLVPVTAFSDPDDAPDTCLHLAKAADGLVSIGPKDLFSLSGGTWRRVA
jgi:hypothetical protein